MSDIEGCIYVCFVIISPWKIFATSNCSDMINKIDFMFLKNGMNEIRIGNIARNALNMILLKELISFGICIFSNKCSDRVFFFLDQFSAELTPDKARDTGDQNMQRLPPLLFEDFFDNNKLP